MMDFMVQEKTRVRVIGDGLNLACSEIRGKHQDLGRG